MLDSPTRTRTRTRNRHPALQATVILGVTVFVIAGLAVGLAYQNIFRSAPADSRPPNEKFCVLFPTPPSATLERFRVPARPEVLADPGYRAFATRAAAGGLADNAPRRLQPAVTAYTAAVAAVLADPNAVLTAPQVDALRQLDGYVSQDCPRE